MRLLPARTVFRVCVCLLVVASTGTALAGPVGPIPGHAPVANDDAERLPPIVAQTNNTTQHEDPDNVSTDGDLGSVASWLSTRLGDQLRGSTIQLSQGQYELADRFVGEEFESPLGRYIEVAGETDSDADDDAGSTFEDAQEQQRELINRTQEYERTFEEYRGAQRNNNATRARQLARELLSLAGEVNRSAAEVKQATETLENQTDLSFTETGDRLDALQTEILAERANITDTSFVGTRLTASANRTTAAVDRPVRVRGRLTVTNDSIDPPDRVMLRVGQTNKTVALDNQGRFAVGYRPKLVPAGPGNVTVQYLPTPTSPYLESQTTVALSVEQVDTTVALGLNSERASFGDTLKIEGSVSAAGREVPAIPVAVQLGDRQFGTVSTDANGTYVVEARLLADIPEGEQVARAALPVAGRAVASANASATLTVVPTETSLTAAVGDADASVRVRGQLTTADGRPVPDRTVRLDAPGVSTVVTQTDSKGRYTATVPRQGSESTAITARFTGEGTNLNASNQTVQVPPLNATSGGDSGQGNNSGDSGQGDGLGLEILLAITVPALLAVFGVALSRRSGVEASTAPDIDGGDLDDEGENSVETVAPATDNSPMVKIEDTVADGEYDLASQKLYGLVRATLSDKLAVGNSGTHWEFYDAVTAADGADSEVCEALRTVTQTYEQATFAPDAVGEQRVRTALTAGERLLNGHAVDA